MRTYRIHLGERHEDMCRNIPSVDIGSVEVKTDSIEVAVEEARVLAIDKGFDNTEILLVELIEGGL